MPLRCELLNCLLREDGKIRGFAVRQPLDEGRRRRELDLHRHAGARRQRRLDSAKAPSTAIVATIFTGASWATAPSDKTTARRPRRVCSVS